MDGAAHAWQHAWQAAQELPLSCAQAVIAGKESRDSLRDIVAMLRNNSTNPQVRDHVAFCFCVSNPVLSCARAYKARG